MLLCELCGRKQLALTRHHLFPRSRQKKPRFQRLHTKQEGMTEIAMLCKGCHGFVHQILTEKELEQSYHSIGALREHPAISKFVEWLSKKPPGFEPQLRR
ncbi:hypothetical protein [Bryobacter aggregatus]|uniref:hypothetical protein n=1 Tax=Bryobacter aggregatus TaxID=360054 RepID=UPI0004E1D2C9|nr:hypothetical protein [Bryobacter aggregatus]